MITQGNFPGLKDSTKWFPFSSFLTYMPESEQIDSSNQSQELKPAILAKSLSFFISQLSLKYKVGCSPLHEVCASSDKKCVAPSSFLERNKMFYLVQPWLSSSTWGLLLTGMQFLAQISSIASLGISISVLCFSSRSKAHSLGKKIDRRSQSSPDCECILCKEGCFIEVTTNEIKMTTPTISRILPFLAYPNYQFLLTRRQAVPAMTISEMAAMSIKDIDILYELKIQKR